MGFLGERVGENGVGQCSGEGARRLGAVWCGRMGVMGEAEGGIMPSFGIYSNTSSALYAEEWLERKMEGC